ncbi:MAG: ABC transporter ATP-binding protein [Clostridia bacterium]|nr:ABC transporter ATP-binding protein [Clostridia bacterium]
MITVVNALKAYIGVQFAMLTRKVIDHASAGNTDMFTKACIQLAGCVLLLVLFIVVITHLRDKMAAFLDRDWKRGLSHTLLNGEYKRVSAYHTGEMINRMNNDVRTVNGALVSIIPNLAAMMTSMIAAASMLAQMDLRFTLIFGGAAVLLIVFTGFIRRHLKGMHKRVSESEGKVNGFIQEMLEKLLMVQALDVSEEMERREEELLEKRWILQRKRKNVSIVAGAGVNFVSGAAEALAIVWCASRLIRGEMSFGTIAAITQLVGQLKAPLVNFSGFIPQYIQMIASAERLREIDEITIDTEKPINGAMLYNEMEAIRTDALCFSYEDGRNSIEFGDMSIPKGAFAALVGPSGAGKSTFLKLLLGIYPPEAGDVYVKTKDGRVPVGRATRKLFAYVPQGNLLISGTLRENLILTNPDANDDMLKRALYVSDLEEMIASLPQGVDTPIGENAMGISEGQAQRISIARAILSGGKVLLLDEGTSALDAETEKTVLRRISEMEDITCIAVTHRPAAMELADIKISIKGS